MKSMTTSEKIIALVYDEQSFDVKLRCHGELDKEQVDYFLDLLDELAVELKGQTHIDKRVVGCMFVVMTTFDLQLDFCSKAIRPLVFDYKVRIEMKIMDCVGQD